MSFEKKRYEVVRACLDKQVLSLLVEQLYMHKKVRYLLSDISETDKYIFNDQMVEKSFSDYGLICFDSLANVLQHRIESIVGKKLYPTYTYSRIYYQGAVMRKHTDRPSCEYSATLCLKNDKILGPWPIWFESKNEDVTSILLNPGDMVVYKGDQLPHWRDTFTGKEQLQVFLHYVDSTGKYSDHIFDKRPGLGLNREQVYQIKHDKIFKNKDNYV